MPFFQNVFDQDYASRYPLADRQLTQIYKVAGNRNTSKTMMAYNQEFSWRGGPAWNFTGNKNLTFNFSLNESVYSSITVDVTTQAASVANVNSFQVAAALNASAAWSAWFVAKVTQDKGGGNWLTCSSLHARENWKAYISNGSAESIMRFNKKAGVAELPTFCSRDTIANASDPRSLGMLIQLDTSSGVDQQVITEAGLNYSVVQADWQLLNDQQSGLFQFQSITTDSGNGNRVTQIIEYNAGASAGDFAKKTVFIYNGGNSTDQPNQIFEMPYTLQSGDLITPP